MYAAMCENTLGVLFQSNFQFDDVGHYTYSTLESLGCDVIYLVMAYNLMIVLYEK